MRTLCVLKQSAILKDSIVGRVAGPASIGGGGRMWQWVTPVKTLCLEGSVLAASFELVFMKGVET
jgi:hypothetical protein